MATQKNPVTRTAISRPEAKMRRQMEDFDQKAMRAQEDARLPQNLDWPEDEGGAGTTTERRLPPIRMNVPNRDLDRMNKKAAAAIALKQQAGDASVVITTDDRDIEAADTVRKQVNAGRFRNFVDTVLPSRPGHDPSMIGPLTKAKKLSANLK